MYSIVESIGPDLQAFFDQSNQQRRDVIISAPVGTTAQAFEQWVQVQSYAELFDMIPDVELIQEGLHSKAIVTANAVIKTNLFSNAVHDGQAAWLQWCNSNQMNPFVPKIALLLIDVDTTRFLVVMERLQPHAGMEINYRMATVNKAVYDAFRGGQRRWSTLRVSLIEVRVEMLDTLAEIQTDLALVGAGEIELTEMWTLEIHKLGQTIVYIDQLMHLYDVRQLMYPFFRKIKKMLTEAAMRGIEVDMHPGNWMIRSNGAPVLLDPLN